jgi:hypothetical protein
MQVAARAANSSTPPVATPPPLLLASPPAKNALQTAPSVSFSAHAAQKEAWLAGYSSGLSHAHAQALHHIEDLGSVQTQLAAQRDSVQDLISKCENLASQLSFLQGTCTQAFTGIWKALGRNTSMIEERLQVEAAFQSRLDSLEVRLAANCIELQQHQAQVAAAVQTARLAWWRHLRPRLPHVPPHVLLQVLLGSAIADLLLRHSAAVIGSRFRYSRKMMRRINFVVAVLSFLRLLFCASQAALPALNSARVFFRVVSCPFAAVNCAADRGNALCLLACFCPG